MDVVVFMSHRRRLPVISRHLNASLVSSVNLDQTIVVADGRAVGFSDYGSASSIVAVPVICCHGGPGSRVQKPELVEAAHKMGLRLIGIDRPGYGLSSLKPGRTIAEWAHDAIAVANHLKLGKFLTVGISTGGAYALCVAAAFPERVIGVVTGCAMTDMNHQPARDSMPGAVVIGSQSSRDAALAMAAEQMGENGEKMMSAMDGGMAFPDADMAVIMEMMKLDPVVLAFDAKQQFANGVQGYVDDRLADIPGWGSFDIGKVTCPVTICHGESDTIVPVLAAHHTKSLIHQAELQLFPKLGHLSVSDVTIAAVGDMARAHKS